MSWFSRSRTWVAIGAVAAAGVAVSADDRLASLTAKDRAAIQQLANDYGTALGTCAAADYARLFEPDGVFSSGPRGSVQGRERLMGLVESEQHCNTPGERKGRPAPMMEIAPAPGGGAVGKGIIGPDGSYMDDTYVKTKAGWRFKMRQVITGREKTAGLAADDFLAIRRMAGEGAADYGDVYTTTPDGPRFRSSGVTVSAGPTGVTGRIYLKSGGRYDDVYAKTANGWRFQSRTFVAEIPPAQNGQQLQVK